MSADSDLPPALQALQQWAASERQSGGSGLGLAVVRAIAVAHHGKARCRATERGGSAFEIRWPVHARR